MDATIGPVSRPASILMTVTPATRSPARIVAGIGVAPRWRGRRDGWMFRIPCGGISRIDGGTSRPKSARTPRSGRSAAISSATSGPRSRSGCRRWTPSRTASSATGTDIGTARRPAGRSGGATTPTTETPATEMRARSEGTAKAPEPKKTVRVGRPLAGDRSGGEVTRALACEPRRRPRRPPPRHHGQPR